MHAFLTNQRPVARQLWTTIAVPVLALLIVLVLMATARSSPLPAHPPAVKASLGSDPPGVKDYCPCRDLGAGCECKGGCKCYLNQVKGAAPVVAPAVQVRGAPVTVCGPNGCYVVPSGRR